MSETSGSSTSSPSAGTTVTKPAAPETAPESGAESVDTKFFIAQDGISGRDGGPYLDQVEREQAEIQRAKVEGREPDLDNPGPNAGTVLVTERKLVDNPHSNPSMSNQTSDVPAAPINEDLVTPYVLPVDTRTEAPTEETTPA